MTIIDFYTHVEDRLSVAARLVAKAAAAHGSARVLTPDAVTTQVEAYLSGTVATQVRNVDRTIDVRVWVPPTLRANPNELPREEWRELAAALLR